MAGSGASTDGRVLRGRRNRERILDALRELIRSGVVQPSAQQVAERAGVGERSVYRHFDDMEKLHAQMASRVLSEVAELVQPGPAVSGPLAERIHGLVEWRARLFEHIAPFRRSGSVQRFRSRVVQRQHARLNRLMRAQLGEVFARELGRLDPVRLEALDAAASFDLWDRLRDEQKLGRAEATAAVEATLRALLAG
jgi:AcrR family transcriptional regulator